MSAKYQKSASDESSHTATNTLLSLTNDQKKLIFTEIKLDPEENFKILYPLGEGAYGTVFMATDRRDNEPCALKVMRFDPEECNDLISEIRIMRECHSPYIVNFKDTFYKEGNIWISMEMCEAGSALDIVKVTKRTLDERQCQCVLYQTLRGLEYLHSKGLIHRDVKAANILINKRGQAKLADFGVARSMRASGAGTTIGSPYWMAPEVLGTDKYGISADIWSLGIVAIEMSTGKPPLANMKPLQAMLQIPKLEAPKISEDKYDDFSQGFNDFIAKCLQKNPNARPTAKQLLKDKWIMQAKGVADKELMSWVAELLPSMEKERELKARMANQDDSFDESRWSEYTHSQRGGSHGGGRDMYGTMNSNNGRTMVQGGTLQIVKDDEAEDSIVQNSENTSEEDQFQTMQRRPSKDGSHMNDDDDDDDDDDNEEYDNFDGGTMITVDTTQKHNKKNTLSSRHGHGGGGYSLTSKSTFDGNTMVRQTSDQSDEEDPYIGGTMIRAPEVESPRIRNDSHDDDDDEPATTAGGDDRQTTEDSSSRDDNTSLNRQTTEGDHSMNETNTNTNTNTHEPETYELAKGYGQKPRSPPSEHAKTQLNLAQQESQVIEKNDPNTVFTPTVKREDPYSPSVEEPKPRSKSQVDRSEKPVTAELVVRHGSGGGDGGYIETDHKDTPKVNAGHSNRMSNVDENPTSPIPHYKHMQILMDNENVTTMNIQGHGASKTGGSNKSVKIHHNLSLINGADSGEISILANQLDFSKLIDGVRLYEHALLAFGCLSTFLFISSYLTMEFTKRDKFLQDTVTIKEIQFFNISMFIAIVCNLLLNPMYFSSFSRKYKPQSAAQLFSITQPLSATPNGNNMSLHISKKQDDHHKQSSIVSNRSDSDDNNSVGSDVQSVSDLVWSASVWTFRFIALCSAVVLSYCIVLQTFVNNSLYSDRTQLYVVLLSLILLIGNLPLMGHYLLYYRKWFLFYYLSSWFIVLGGTFSFFHLWRDSLVGRSLMAYFGFNVVILLFHAIASMWAAFNMKHRALYAIDSVVFAASNHYRFYWNGNGSSNIVAMELNVNNSPSIRSFRAVACCCNRLICDSNTMLRFQAYASAISFWTFLGVLYTIGFEYVGVSNVMFIFVNTVWNPLYYSKAVFDIRDSRCCSCSLGKCGYYLSICVTYLLGAVGNVLFFVFSLSAFALGNTEYLKYTIFVNAGSFIFCVFVYWLPAVGYSFYRVPVAYGVINMFSALFCFLIPVSMTFSTTTNESYSYSKYFFMFQEENQSVGIFVCVIVFALFLVMSGGSCVLYRIRKALVEKTLSMKLFKQFDMTMCVSFSFILAIAELCTNGLWVFGDNFGGNDWLYIGLMAKIFFFIELGIQSLTLVFGVYSVKIKLDSHHTMYFNLISHKISNNCGCCIHFMILPFMYLAYLMFMCAFSLLLAVTKLLAIQQISDYWLSFVITPKSNESYCSPFAKHNSSGKLRTIQPHSSNQSEENTQNGSPVALDIDAIELQTNNKQQPNTPSEISRRLSFNAQGSVHFQVYKCCACCTPNWMRTLSVNEAIFNSYLMSEMIVESLPLLILNLTNMWFNKQSNLISLVSAGTSAVFLLYSVGKIVYYVGYRDWNLSKFVS